MPILKLTSAATAAAALLLSDRLARCILVFHLLCVPRVVSKIRLQVNSRTAVVVMCTKGGTYIHRIVVKAIADQNAALPENSKVKYLRLFSLLVTHRQRWPFSLRSEPARPHQHHTLLHPHPLLWPRSPPAGLATGKLHPHDPARAAATTRERWVETRLNLTRCSRLIVGHEGRAVVLVPLTTQAIRSAPPAFRSGTSTTRKIEGSRSNAQNLKHGLHLTVITQHELSP